MTTEASRESPMGTLSQQIADATSNVGAVAQDQAKRGLKHARSHVDSMMADASDRVGTVASAAQARAVTIGSKASVPYAFLAAAVGGRPGSPRSQNNPAMAASPSRAIGASRCSSGACCEHPA
jgi:hypothetical protein